MELCIATMAVDIPETVRSAVQTATVIGWDTTSVHLNTIEKNDGVVGSYQKLYEQSKSDVLIYMHDDVQVHEEGWDVRVRNEFHDPSVGVVGFGGALVHGSPNLYKRPYYLPWLGRSGYLSNVDDAEVHGERFTGAADVAVLDGFVLAIRRSFLDKIGGFQQLIDAGIDFIGYDYMICGLAHRLGYRTRVVGVRCHHKGGGTSTKVNVDRQEEYDRAHRIIYEELRDVLPWECA